MLQAFQAATPATPQEKPHYATVMGEWEKKRCGMRLLQTLQRCCCGRLLNMLGM